MTGLVFVLLLSGPAISLAPAETPPCPGFTVVEAQGPSCPVDGGWEVLLPDGSRFSTHGPDAIPVDLALDSDTSLETPLTARDPVCVELPTEPHIQVLYAYQIRTPDRSAERLPMIQDLVRKANGIFHDEGVRTGGDMDLRVRCSDGEVHIETVPLAVREIDFTQITTELRAHGYTLRDAKYWVWVEGRHPTWGGQGSTTRDTRPIAGNAANGGPMYALTYGYDSTRIWLHELGHNLGAVQTITPNSTGAGHCNDGWDIMCYDDSGPKADFRWVCTDRQWWDCNHDDYFHSRPAEGAYLWDHWNTGSGLNRFVEHHSGGCLPIQGDPGLKTDHMEAGSVVASVDIPAPCTDRHFTLQGAGLSDYDICWYAGTTGLSCHEARGPDKGKVPSTADRAEIVLKDGFAGFFTLSMN